MPPAAGTHSSHNKNMHISAGARQPATDHPFLATAAMYLAADPAYLVAWMCMINGISTGRQASSALCYVTLLPGWRIALTHTCSHCLRLDLGPCGEHTLALDIAIQDILSCFRQILKERQSQRHPAAAVCNCCLVDRAADGLMSGVIYQKTMQSADAAMQMRCCFLVARTSPPDRDDVSVTMTTNLVLGTQTNTSKHVQLENTPPP